MVPQVHLNFGPTSFEKAYQLVLPLVPGSIFAGGLLIARQDLSGALRAIFALHAYGAIAIFLFAAYIVGFVLVGLSAIFTGTVSGIVQSLVFRSWTPVRGSYFLSQCTIWRQVAAQLLGEKLAPVLPQNPPPTSVIEKIKAPMQDLTNKMQHDQLWEEWYRILQDYLLRDVPLISNDAMWVWLGIQATACATLALGFVNPHARHWLLSVFASVLILFVALLPFMVVFGYLGSERLTYWDFTARLLAEIHRREVPDKEPTTVTVREEKT